MRNGIYAGTFITTPSGGFYRYRFEDAFNYDENGVPVDASKVKHGESDCNIVSMFCIKTNSDATLVIHKYSNTFLATSNVAGGKVNGSSNTITTKMIE